jgi:hypothetical protein
MKKISPWVIASMLSTFILSGCTTASSTIDPKLQPWFEFACDTYEEMRPVIIALLDAAATNPEIVPEKYRADVKKFREDTGPRLDHGVRLLCAARAGEAIEQTLATTKRGIDWNAIALTTVRVATIGLQLYAQGKLTVPSANLGEAAFETITVKLQRRAVRLYRPDLATSRI